MKGNFITTKSGALYNLSVIRYVTWSNVYKAYMAYTETGSYIMPKMDFEEIKVNFVEITSTPHLIHYFMNPDKIEYIVKEMTNFSAPKVYAVKIGEQKDGMFATISINDKEFDKLKDYLLPQEPAEEEKPVVEVTSPEQKEPVTEEPKTEESAPEPKPVKNTLLKNPKLRMK